MSVEQKLERISALLGEPTEERRRLTWELKRVHGLTFMEIACQSTLTEGMVKRDVYTHESCHSAPLESTADTSPGIFRVSERTYTGRFEPRDVPVFDGAWRLSGDFMVINDVHIPATNWEFANLALQVALKHLDYPRRCIIAGDLINGDALSRWDDLVLCTPLADELQYAEAYLEHLSTVFDEIYIIRGNHENRVLLSAKGQLHAPYFRRMITDNKRVRFSMYSWLRVASGGQEWHITHQRNYSRNPLIVARKLAGKHRAHIIATHQHHSAAGRDESDTYTCIDSGGLHDWRKMAYVGLEDSISPVMSNGFVLLRDGVGTLFTPPQYRLMDWDLWLDDMSAQEAQKAA